jgi:hypothetical protein
MENRKYLIDPKFETSYGTDKNEDVEDEEMG